MRAHLERYLLLLPLLALAGSTVPAFMLTKPPVRWFETPHLLTIDDRGLASIDDVDHGVTAAIQAAASWNAGGVEVLNPVAGPAVFDMKDGLSFIYFQDPARLCSGSCLYTFLTARRKTKGTCGGLNVVDVAESDIVIDLENAVLFASRGEPDGCSGELLLETVVAHEVGHLIGLEHVEDTSALMYFGVSLCEDKVPLADDLAGRDALYSCTLEPITHGH